MTEQEAKKQPLEGCQQSLLQWLGLDAHQGVLEAPAPQQALDPRAAGGGVGKKH